MGEPQSLKLGIHDNEDWIQLAIDNGRVRRSHVIEHDSLDMRKGRILRVDNIKTPVLGLLVSEQASVGFEYASADTSVR